MSTENKEGNPNDLTIQDLATMKGISILQVSAVPLSLTRWQQ